MEKMKELYEKVAADSELQTKFTAIIGDAEKAGEAATGEKLIAFAKEAGYDVSLDEMETFFKKFSEDQDGELSEADLDMVAGGKTIKLGTLVSLSSMGIGCGVMSAVKEIGGNSCKGYLNADVDGGRL